MEEEQVVATYKLTKKSIRLLAEKLANRKRRLNGEPILRSQADCDWASCCGMAGMAMNNDILPD